MFFDNLGQGLQSDRGDEINFSYCGYFEYCKKPKESVRQVIWKIITGQATKGKWRMPWRQRAMKDAVGCDKPRGAVKQA